MFAIDVMAPINAAFALSVLFCLAACIGGMPDSRADAGVPAAFLDVLKAGEQVAGSNGHTRNGTQHDGARRSGDGDGGQGTA